LRFADYLKPGGTAVVNEMEIVPITVSAGGGAYPPAAAVQRVFEKLGAKLVMVPGESLATEAGTSKAANVVLLGAISTLLPVPEDVWWECLAQRVPKKFLELNRTAFASGRGASAAAG
jgi:indolepyruvate ferredoxin oxidoreductase beta subunit